MTSSALRARPAVPDDAAQAVEVLRASITELCVADHQNDPRTLELWLQNKTPERFIRWLADENTLIVVAELDAKIVGIGAVHRGGEIRLCYVKPSRQGLGVGGLLLSTVEDQARLWGLHKLELNSSLTARSFYEHHGYAVSGEPTPGFGVSICYPYRKELTL